MNKLYQVFLVGLAAIVVQTGSSAFAQETFKFVTTVPGQNPMNGAFSAWAERVNDRLGDEAQIEVISGSALAAHGQIIDRISLGAIDIGFELQSYFPGQYPRSDVAGLPGMYEDAVSGSAALWDLYQSGALDKEYEGVKILAMWVFPNADLLTVDPLEPGRELKGMRIATNSPMRNQIAEELGAAPLSFKITEWYQALQRGTIDGLIQSTASVTPFSLQEVVSHVVQYPFGGNAGFVVMSQEKFDALSDEAKSVFEEESGRKFSIDLGKTGEGLVAFGRKAIIDLGGESRLPSAEETEMFDTAVAKVRDEWIEAHPQYKDIVTLFAQHVEKAEAETLADN